MYAYLHVCITPPGVIPRGISPRCFIAPPLPYFPAPNHPAQRHPPPPPQELSPGLRTDVNLQLCAELVATVPVFLECSPIVVRAMVSKLQRETHVAGDFVFRCGRDHLV